MQEKLTSARPYAAAAFAVAREDDDVAAWSDMLEILGTAVAETDLKRLISHPKVSETQLLEILDEILGERLDDKRRNFLQVLADAERLNLAPEIATQFERARADSQGVVDVTVTSAFELEDGTGETIAASVRKRTGKDVAMHSDVDPALIGGAIIRIGDSVIDLSMRGRLGALRQHLS